MWVNESRGVVINHRPEPSHAFENAACFSRLTRVRLKVQSVHGKFFPVFSFRGKKKIPSCIGGFSIRRTRETSTSLEISASFCFPHTTDTPAVTLQQRLLLSRCMLLLPPPLSLHFVQLLFKTETRHFIVSGKFSASRDPGRMVRWTVIGDNNHWVMINRKILEEETTFLCHLTRTMLRVKKETTS